VGDQDCREETDMTPNHVTFADKSFSFARSIGEQWQDPNSNDLPSFQRRYLYVQSFSAAHTASSYWILRRADKQYDCNVLARNLLERIFNSRVAHKSPRHAVELIAWELSERIRHLRLFQTVHPQMDMQTIQGYESDLRVFLSLLGMSSAPQWDFYRRADEAGISSWAYRGVYSLLSGYTHAGYERGRPKEISGPTSLADFVALLAPIDTAFLFHRISCTDVRCEIGSQYKALYDEFERETIGRTTSNDG